MQNEWTLEIARLQVELAKWEEQVNVRDVHVDALKVEIATLKSALDAEVGYSRRREDEIERLKEENDSLKLGVSSLGVIVHQLRGALGYAVPDHTPANPEILNRIADALNKEIAALQARIKELEGALKRFADFILEECDEWPLAHEAARNAKKVLNG